ncbi:hypothetical protein JOB18_008157 [Solea senegalensis]|uniref:Uncharacterized protein n=1 Tax=Solea senegalensis TaxID=28829 RepID=A0AAV6PPW5_SOLSE|nr:hypothetical protein JOB18_008157 [Solea senegalensis]
MKPSPFSKMTRPTCKGQLGKKDELFHQLLSKKDDDNSTVWQVNSIIASYKKCIDAFNRGGSMKAAFDCIGADRNTVSRTAPIAELSIAAPDIFKKVGAWNERKEKLSSFVDRLQPGRRSVPSGQLILRMIQGTRHSQPAAPKMCVEDHDQESSTCQGQPENTDVNVEVKTSKAAPNFSKLRKQRRHKATRRVCKEEQAQPEKSTARRKVQTQKIKYATCPKFRVKKKKAMKTKADTTNTWLRETEILLFRAETKKDMAQRYKTNPDVSESKKAYNTRRYARDQRYKVKKMTTLHTRYHSDPDFKLHHIRSCAQHRRNKLASNATFQMHYRLQCALKIKAKYKLFRHRQQKMPKPVVTRDPHVSAQSATDFSFLIK